MIDIASPAGNWPAAVKVVTEWFPARERALAAGVDALALPLTERAREKLRKTA